jgi:hypothetical protein
MNKPLVRKSQKKDNTNSGVVSQLTTGLKVSWKSTPTGWEPMQQDEPFTIQYFHPHAFSIYKHI